MPSSLLPRTDVLLGSGDLMETVSAEGRALLGKGDTPMPTAGLHYKAGLCVFPCEWPEDGHSWYGVPWAAETGTWEKLLE